MIKVIFVGDAPSKQNTSQHVAFVGTRSFRTLMRWVHFLNPYFYIFINSDLPYDLRVIEDLSESGFKVVALGKRASYRLIDRGIEHFPLPHPSGLNRKLNDKTYVYVLLLQARKYLYG